MLQMTAIPILVIFLFFCYSAQLQETTPVGCQSSFPCRGLGILGYPFFSSMQNECGLFEVDCYHRKVKLGNESQWYDLLNINEHDGSFLEIRDNLLQELLESRSCDSFKNITLPPSSPSISYRIYNSNTTFVRCTDNSKVTAEYFGGYYNYTGCPGYSLYYTYPYDDNGDFTVASLPPTCSVIQMPVERSRGRKYTSDPFQIITANLSVRWGMSYECFQCYYESRGKCSTNNHQEFQCIGGKPPNPALPELKQGTRTGVPIKVSSGTRAAILIVVLIGSFGAAIVILIVVVFSLRRKIATKWRNIFDSLTLKRYRYSDIKKVVMKWRKNFNSLPPKRYRYSDIKKVVMKWRKKTKSHRTVKTFLKNYASLTPKRYRHSDIKKMTNSFKDKLGEGGYGFVYKGKFRNGSLVAVKVLKESKGNGDEFFNEVASISRTSHVNVVTLLGFCIEGRKRALVYEFMPNGSLEKFAYDRTSSTNRQLGWDKYYRIAIGIARGLEYLHRGCNTRILHFDIKPHNILLDEDFVPKISDFGLAKLCPGKESAISMLNARGTIGYIAPEVFCRNIGRVSHKSDVYSYGMMVLEMVGWRRNVEVEVGHTSEIYFPDWIYRKLELDKELGMHGITNEDENVYARKMIIVSLWCIQSNPSTRPSMSRVVEMLEGSLESLEIPPEPILSSPQLSPSHSSTIESTIEIS